MGKGSVFSILIPKFFEKEHPNSCLLINDSSIKNKSENTKVSDEKAEIFILNSNSILQFKISVGLKKYGYLVHPFFDSVDFVREITLLEDKKAILIVDKNVPNIDYIIEKSMQKDIKVLLIGEIERNYNHVINFDEKLEISVLIEKLKDFLI